MRHPAVMDIQGIGSLTSEGHGSKLCSPADDGEDEQYPSPHGAVIGHAAQRGEDKRHGLIKQASTFLEYRLKFFRYERGSSIHWL